MNNKFSLKEKLQGKLEAIQTNKNGSPITNIKLDKNTVTEIEQLTTEIEHLNSHLHPLVNAISLLNGAWQLQYSTAREIRASDSLPLGLQIGQVYQVINVAHQQFFNLADVKHPFGI